MTQLVTWLRCVQDKVVFNLLVACDLEYYSLYSKIIPLVTSFRQNCRLANSRLYFLLHVEFVCAEYKAGSKVAVVQKVQPRSRAAVSAVGRASRRSARRCCLHTPPTALSPPTASKNWVSPAPAPGLTTVPPARVLPSSRRRNTAPPPS